MILVVDDHLDSRRALVRLLGLEGFRAAAAGGGAEALEVARRDRPELIVLDQVMPGMSGVDVLKALKADPELRDVPVIFYSATDGRGQIEAMALGARDWVLKASVGWPELLEKIEKNRRGEEVECGMGRGDA